jgi:hypothetical protein
MRREYNVRRLTIRVLIGLFAVLFFPHARRQAQCYPTAAQSVLQTSASDRNYQAIKLLEGCFQIPAPTSTVSVIECDSAGHCGRSNKLLWTTEAREQDARTAKGIEYEKNTQ